MRTLSKLADGMEKTAVRIRRRPLWTILFGCVLLAAAAWAQRPRAAPRATAAVTATNTTNFTFSTVTIYTDTTANVTQQVNTYLVELKARMQGGAYLFDQTYNVAYTDPSIQAAITQAENLLTNAAAVSFTGPTQLSSTQSTSSATVTGPYVVTATNVSTAVTEYVGPQTIMIDTNQSTPFTLLAGQVDFDALTTTDVYQTQTATTTNTTLTSQVYEIDGAPAGVTPATPAPPPLLLALMGIAACGLFVFRKRMLRRRGNPGRAS